jgi:hypothetical protein
MDPVASQRFFNFLVSRARAAVIELQDRVQDGRLDDAYKQRWYTHLLEEMVHISVFILFMLCHLLSQESASICLGAGQCSGWYLYIPPFYKSLSQHCSGRCNDFEDHILNNILSLNAHTLPSDPSQAVARCWDAWWLADWDPTGTLPTGVTLFESQVSPIYC